MGRSGVKSHTDGSNVKKKEARSKYDLASFAQMEPQTVDSNLGAGSISRSRW